MFRVGVGAGRQRGGDIEGDQDVAPPGTVGARHTAGGLRVALDEGGLAGADVGGRGVRRDPREAVGAEGDTRRHAVRQLGALGEVERAADGFVYAIAVTELAQGAGFAVDRQPNRLRPARGVDLSLACPLQRQPVVAGVVGAQTFGAPHPGRQVAVLDGEREGERLHAVGTRERKVPEVHRHIAGQPRQPPGGTQQPDTVPGQLPTLDEGLHTLPLPRDKRHQRGRATRLIEGDTVLDETVKIIKKKGLRGGCREIPQPNADVEHFRLPVIPAAEGSDHVHGWRDHRRSGRPDAFSDPLDLRRVPGPR